MVVAAGVAVFGLVYSWLILSGNTSIMTSADPGATKSSLWATAVPALAAMLLTRLIPPRTEVSEPLADVPRSRLRWEALVLLALAVAFPFTILGLSKTAWYLVLKVLMLLLAALVVIRLGRRLGGGAVARAIPRPVVWLAPVPAVLVWFVLSEVWPFARPVTQELPDPITLAVASSLTLLTASVLEEFFYRGWLQTRLESLYGRWPAILVSSLVFAFMHLDRLGTLGLGLGLASIVAFQGVFGLMQGYLWSRYRNLWAVIVVHVAVNLVYLDLLVGAAYSGRG
ncbi:hypothetical protein GCM10027569_62930 [Flindersiella endophytica]